MDVDARQLGVPLAKALGIAEERGPKFVEALANAVSTALASEKEVNLKNVGRFVPVAGAVSAAPVASEVSARMLEPRLDQVESMLAKFAELLQRELFAGRRVLLEGVGTFEVKIFKPFVERAYGGHKVVKPPTCTINFFPAVPGKYTFTPDDQLKNRANQYKEASVLLLMREKDFFVDTLIYYFKKSGWAVDAITSVDECLRRIQGSSAYLLVVDTTVQNHQSVVEEVKLNIGTNSVPVILLCPEEKTLVSPQDVMVVGDNNLFEPFEVRHLLDIIDDEVVRACEEELIFRQQVQIYVPTDEKSIDSAIEKVNRLLAQSGLNDEHQNETYVAFREAILNAAQHGNKYRREKRIEVQYLLDQEKVTIAVKDQGDGFDYNFYVKQGQGGDAVGAARRRYQQGRLGGLGIMLMLRSVDKLEYFGSGNQLSLTKYVKKRAPSKTAVPAVKK